MKPDIRPNEMDIQKSKWNRISGEMGLNISTAKWKHNRRSGQMKPDIRRNEMDIQPDEKRISS